MTASRATNSLRIYSGLTLPLRASRAAAISLPVADRTVSPLRLYLVGLSERMSEYIIGSFRITQGREKVIVVFCWVHVNTVSE